MGLGGVAENCTVAGDNPQEANVTAGDTTTVTFAVECSADTGDLEVSVTTTGDNLDSDGYTVNVDGTQTMAVASNGTVTFAGLAIGEHSLSLDGVATNCTVVGDISRTATVAANATAQESYEVTCAANQITVQAQTGGDPIDPDGYTVTLDDVDSQSLDVNGSVMFGPVTAGLHKLELTGMAANCTVDDENPRNVDVVDGESAGTTFVVSCGGGSLVVNTSTSGSNANLDPDGYTVVVDGTDGTESQAIENDGQVSFPGLADGTHSVELQGVDSPCVVLGFNPRAVEVPGEETFEVQCGESGSVITFIRDSNVWQILPDGNGELQLTTDGVAVGGYGHVKWSPDGTRMVFPRSTTCSDSWTGPCNAIFTADADGSDIMQVTFPESGVRHWRPDWSPDGTKLVVYQSDDRGGWKLSILIVDSDGNNPNVFKTGDGTTINYAFPSWTPDGEIIYVERVIGESSDDGYVAIINVNGSGYRRLTSSSGARIYEPDYSGNRIAFKHKLYDTETSFDLMVMDGEGSPLRNLTNQAYDVGDIELSPDGSQIAYTLEAAGSLWIIDADGNSNAIQLTDGAGVAWRALP